MLNIAFIGSGGDFSLLPMKYLINSEHNLCLVGVDGISKTLNTDPRLQIFRPAQAESVESIARTEQIPLIDLQQNLTQLCTSLKEYQLDLIIVACYSKKLPQEILTIPKIAAINLHLSLLPAYRGPVPLFWQFRQGLNDYGISLHKMDAGFDTGPIVAQQAVKFSDGLEHQELNTILAEQGTGLLKGYLQALQTKQVIEKVQAEKLSSYMTYPQAKDFVISNSWTAQRIFNFIRATKHWGRPYPCDLGGRLFHLKDVISYSIEIQPNDFASDTPYKIHADNIFIACQSGMLKARLFIPINDRIPS